MPFRASRNLGGFPPTTWEQRSWNPEAPGRDRTFKGFNRKGLQVVFGLLAGGDLLKAPYRERSKATDVATGTVGEGMKDLVERVLVLQHQKGRTLVQGERLMEGWLANYPYKLRPHLQPR